MTTPTPFNQLVLRAILHKVSPMVIRVLAVPDYLDLIGFDEVFRTMLGWDGIGFSFRIHGQEIHNYMSRRTKAQRKTLREFQLRPRETFLYTCGGLNAWEWEMRLMAEVGGSDDGAPVCLAGRGAAPPEYCGGPTGYRLMLKRQEEGASMGTAAQVEAAIAILTEAEPDAAPDTWDILRSAVGDGMRSIDQRLEQYGPLEPHHFSLKDANQRLVKLMERGRYHEIPGRGNLRE